MSQSRADKRRHQVEDPLSAVSGSASALTVFLIFLVGAAGALAFLSAQSAEPLVLTIMGVLATLGAFFVFGIAAGHIRISERTERVALAGELAERADAGLVLTSNDGQILHANRQGVAVLGRDQLGEVRPLEEVFATVPHGGEVLFRLVRAAQRGDPHREDLWFADDSGLEGHGQWWRISVKPFGTIDIPEHAGRATLWTFDDITKERLEADYERKIFEAELSHFADMPAGLVVVGRDGRVEFLNQTLARWLGHDGSGVYPSMMLGEMLGRQDVDLLLSLAALDKIQPRAIELDFVTSSGERWPALCVLTTPDKDQAGGPLRHSLQIAVLDRELVQGRTPDVAGLAQDGDIELANLFRTAPFGIAMAGSDGAIRFSNPAFDRLMCGVSSTAVGAQFDTLIPGANQDVRSIVREALSAATHGKAEIQPIEIEVGDEGEFVRRLYVQSLGGRAQRPGPAIIYLTDATEERALGEKFAQSQKMEAVGKLAGGIAHDFNNVLTAIIGFSDLLLASHRPSDHAFKNIQNIRSSANHAAGLVKQLLAFSRRQTLEPEMLRLNEVVTDLSVILNRLLGEDVELKISSGRDLWAVKADLNQLNQVVVNLAVNARDAMPDGGRLTIRTRNVTERESQRLAERGMGVGEYVMIEVEDTGIGMAPDVMQKIFEPFFTTKDVGKGTGLGLSTVYGIIKQTGGYVFADSEIGQGTVFRVYLPRFEGGDEAAGEAARKAGKKRRSGDLTGHGRVLVVEDEDAVRLFATEALRRQGYEVLQACDGLEALDVMEDNDHQVDLVVSDVKMPEMDGPTLFKELRQHNPDLKFVFVSGYTDDAFTKTLDADAEYTFLPKPYTLAQIAEVVKDQLR